MDDHCRLCSLRTKPLIDIFSNTGNSHKLTEKITQRLQIFVTQDDFLSKSICCNCCGKLEIFDQFVKDVHTTQTVLHKQKTGALKQTKVIKKEEDDVIDTIQIDDDVQPVTSSCYDNTPSMSRKPSIESKDHLIHEQNDRHVSVIRYQTVHFNNNNDHTKSLNSSSKERTEIVFKDDETTYVRINGELSASSEPTSEPLDRDDFLNGHGNDAEDSGDPKAVSKNRVSENALKKLQSDLSDKMVSVKRISSDFDDERRVLRSNPKHFFRSSISKNDSVDSNCNDYCKIETRKELKVRDTRRRSSQTPVQRADRKDFSAQMGNTLMADLRGLKNSLLLRKVNAKNALVLTIPVPVLPPNNSVEDTFLDTTTTKGCQTEILLGAKSVNRNVVVYQKFNFEGRSFAEIGSESDAVIVSVLPT